MLFSSGCSLDSCSYWLHTEHWQTPHNTYKSQYCQHLILHHFQLKKKNPREVMEIFSQTSDRSQNCAEGLLEFIFSCSRINKNQNILITFSTVTPCTISVPELEQNIEIRSTSTSFSGRISATMTSLAYFNFSQTKYVYMCFKAANLPSLMLRIPRWMVEVKTIKCTFYWFVLVTNVGCNEDADTGRQAGGRSHPHFL